MGKRGRPPYPDVLTPREWEVLDLLRDGLSNPEIADRLGISRDGAKYHVSEILTKLGLGSRTEAAAWQPGAQRPWWTAGAVPIVWLWRRAPSAIPSVAMAAGVIAIIAALGGIGLLAFLLVNSDDPTATAPARTMPGEITGLFSEPRTTTPDRHHELEPLPASQFEPWDGSSTILYDRLTGEATNLGQGQFGRFSAGGRWMAWNAGPPYNSDLKEAWVIELATLERRSLGPGSFIHFIDETHVLLQVAVGGQGEFEVVDLLTGEREPTDVRPPQQRSGFVDGLTLTSTTLDQINGVENAEGETLLTFEAFRASFAGPGEIVLATVPEADNINIFLVDIASGAATFVASSPITRVANYPLAANEDYVIWTDDYCRFPDAGKTRVLDRRTGEITELDQRLWVSLTPDGLIASGPFGAKTLIDPETFEYVFVVPDIDPDHEGEGSASDVSWSRDYRYVSRGFAGGHGGLCG